MTSPSALTRRQLLKGTVFAATAAAFSGVPAAIAAACRKTPAQTEGPFYPVDPLVDDDTDLTRLPGSDEKARGAVVYIQGQVVDQDCKPVPSALVEIWQACDTGRYDHPNDPNTSVELDPNFQYYGKAVTDGEGRYLFKTIIPGAYPASGTWWRPPHIHFKVIKTGYHELTTQMYFEGQALNESDLILKALPPADQKAVTVRFEKPPQGSLFDPDSTVGSFQLVVRRV
jgi:protocatechuate 3,4-dioxygenase, beta subunit